MRGKFHSLKPLQALCALGKHGSLAGAAQELHLTPPAVHTQLKNLEEMLQIQLVDRPSSGPMSLTEAGQRVAQAARRVNAELDMCLRDLDALREGKAGHVNLGVVSTAKYFAPGLVACLKERHPDIDIRLDIGNREHILNALAAQSLHLVIMGRPPREPEVISEVIGPHPHILIGKPDHPLAKLPEIPPELLLKEVFILREEGSGTRLLMNRYLDRIGEGQVYDSVVMGSNETIKQAVMAGLGIALISEHTVTEELRSKRLVSLHVDGLPLVRSWHLLSPGTVPLTPTAQIIKTAISKMQGTFLPPHLG